MKLKLTTQAIKALPIPKTGRVDYADTVVPGLILRVASTGTKSYSVTWWRGSAKPRVTIGVTDDSPKRGPGAHVERLSLADARTRAQEVLQAVRIGADPAAERREQRAAVTFSDLAREYVIRWARVRQRPKTAKEGERTIEKVLIPRWGSRKAVDIRKRDVIELLDEYADSGRPVARNRIQALISQIFNFGIRRDLIESNPATLIDREPETPRTRVLSDDELKILLPLIRAEGGHAAAGFRLLLLTGQRANEVFGMRWSEIEGDVWTLPGARSKNKRPSAVPLVPEALAIINDLRAQSFGASDGFVFRSRVGGKPFRGYAKAHLRLKAAALKAGVPADWITHDFRRTCSTGLEKLGVPEVIVEAVANHTPQGVTRRVYALYDYLPEKRAALTRWAAHVAGLDPTTTGTVVEMRRSA